MGSSSRHLILLQLDSAYLLTMILAVNGRFFPKGPNIASDKSAFHFFPQQKTIPLFLYYPKINPSL